VWRGAGIPLPPSMSDPLSGLRSRGAALGDEPADAGAPRVPGDFPKPVPPPPRGAPLDVSEVVATRGACLAPSGPAAAPEGAAAET